MTHSYAPQQVFSRKSQTFFQLLTVSSELPTSTSPSGNRFSTCQTPSGTAGGSNSSQHYRSATSGSPASQTFSQEVLFSLRSAKHAGMYGLLDWTQAISGKDSKVCQVEVKTVKPDGTSLFVGPGTEVVLPLPGCMDFGVTCIHVRRGVFCYDVSGWEVRE